MEDNEEGDECARVQVSFTISKEGYLLGRFTQTAEGTRKKRTGKLKNRENSLVPPSQRGENDDEADSLDSGRRKN